MIGCSREANPDEGTKKAGRDINPAGLFLTIKNKALLDRILLIFSVEPRDIQYDPR
jgi:hypothetical protein